MAVWQRSKSLPGPKQARRSTHGIFARTREDLTNLVGGQARDEGRALASSGEGGGHLRLSEADPAADRAGVDPDARVLLLGHLSDLKKNKQNRWHQSFSTLNIKYEVRLQACV